MRRNRFGEAYCTTTDEVRDVLDQRDRIAGDVYVPCIDSPENDDEKFTAEVADSFSGETICYIEADTEHAVRLIIAELGIELQA